MWKTSRRFLKTLVVGLTFCMLAAVASSYWRSAMASLQWNGVERPRDHGELAWVFSIESSRGSLGFSWTERGIRYYDLDRGPPERLPLAAFSTFFGPPQKIEDDPSANGWRASWLGISIGRDGFMGAGGSVDVSYLTLPYWLILLPMTIWTTFIIPQAARQLRERSRGLCRKCGYDLRATPLRCPECGYEICTN
jgi:hypothetical protein